MFAVGWGANQFSPMLIVYRHELRLTAGEVAGLFLVYMGIESGVDQGLEILFKQMTVDQKGAIATFDHELAEEFFRAVSNNSKMTLHLWVRSGSNAHHMIEASFKAFARALREAVSIDPEESGVPSTKGTLTE